MVYTIIHLIFNNSADILLFLYIQFKKLKSDKKKRLSENKMEKKIKIKKTIKNNPPSIIY